MFRKKSENREIVIDLTGPDGNAFALLAYARRFCDQLGLDYEQVSEEMKSGDYDNLVWVFDQYFGNYVILEC